MRRDEGLTLVEMMVAIFVLAIAVLAIAAVASSSLATVRLSRDRQHATNAASAAIEDARSRDFSELVLDAAAAGLPSPACQDAEPLITDTSPGAPVPFQVAAGPSGKITVTTYVTWFDDPDDGAEGCGHDDRAAKRVTSVASWTERGREREVVESTVVAEAGRGLPVPDFDIGVDSSINFANSDITGGTQKCIDHLLRNFGAEDSYDWTVVSADGLTNVSGPETDWMGRTYFRTNGNRWHIRMYFEHPLQATAPTMPTDPTSQTPPSGVELMEDINLDSHPEANGANGVEHRVPNDGTARLWVCYYPDKTQAPSTYSNRTFEITVRSRFDHRVTRSVDHNVTVGNLNTALVLSDPDDTTAHRRGLYMPNGSFDQIPVFEMGPVGTLQPLLPHPDGDIPNWDTDFDSTSRTVGGSTVVGYPGIRQPNDGTTLLDGIWHEQVSGTTVLSNARLVLWTSFAQALDAQANGTTLATPRTLRFTITLEALRHNETPKNPQQIIWQGTRESTHDAAGWKENIWDVDLSAVAQATRTLSDKDYLRLRVHCRSASDEPCHLAYDSSVLQSRLLLGTQ